MRWRPAAGRCRRRRDAVPVQHLDALAPGAAAHRGSPMPDKAGSAGAAQSPGRAAAEAVKSAMAGVLGGAGLRPAACDGTGRMAHSASAPASRRSLSARWRCDGRVGVMQIGPC